MEKAKIVIDEKVLEKIPDEKTNGKKERAKPVPQKYEAIEAGALKLLIHERVKLKNALVNSITIEVNQLKEQAENAQKLVNGE